MQHALGHSFGYISNMTEQLIEDNELKVVENRLRRVAQRQGLELRKSRRRDPRAYDYGRYWVHDPVRNFIVFGGDRGADLAAVAGFLGEP